MKTLKKALSWALAIAIGLAALCLAVMGVKLLNHDYEILSEAYFLLGCWIVILVCGIARIFTQRCPHCRKLLPVQGESCSHCGKKL